MKPLVAMSAGLSLLLMATISSGAQSLDNRNDIAEFARGNTLLVLSRSWPTFIYLHPAGHYFAAAPQGLAVTKGSWWFEGNKLCVREEVTPTSAQKSEAHCVVVKSRSFEETWQVDDALNGVNGKLTYQWLRGRTSQLPQNVTGPN